jgi:hypothetical protein
VPRVSRCESIISGPPYSLVTTPDFTVERKASRPVNSAYRDVEHIDDGE